MADQDHVDAITRGLAAFRIWRRENRLQDLDLSGADLSGMKLAGFQLTHANLHGARLVGADLSGASLADADLSDTDLTDANLTGAFAIFADLSRAKLTNTVLDDANLTGSALVDCNFEGASFNGTALTRVTVSSSIGEARLEGARLTYIGLGPKRFIIFSLIPSHVLKMLLEYSTRNNTVLGAFPIIVRMYAAAFQLGLGRVSWPVARHFGNLTLLTRASYLLLVLVPLLAAAWPAVRGLVSYYDDKVVQSAESLAVASKNLEQWADVVETGAASPATEELTMLAAELAKKAVELQSVLGEARIPPPRFPRTFAALFFAALFSAIGHLLYQLRADSLIKETTRKAYVERVTADFRNELTPLTIALDRALHIIAKSASTHPDEAHPNLVEQHGRVVWIPSTSQEFESLPEERRWAALQRAAELEYDAAARRSRLAATISLYCYLVASSLIVWVLYVQSVQVLTESGLL
jgi:uncharacterized protein YjbI with pentapeptide repeats